MRAKRIYLDSNVFITLADAEIGRNLRGLFIEAENFIEKVKAEGHIIVLSRWFFDEVKSKAYLGREDVIAYFKDRKVSVEIVENPKELKLPDSLRFEFHYGDAFHLSIALHSKCDCIVTFNIKDFEKARTLIEVFEPGEFTN